MSESYEVGTRAWQPDAVEGWVPSEVEQKLVEGDKVRLVFRLENGEVRQLLLLRSVEEWSFG
jgi:myosin-5